MNIRFSRARVRTAIFAVALTTGVFPAAAAQAHVTLEPAVAPAGSWTTFQVKVPNETDSTSTVKVDLKMPAGVVSASWQPVPGWQGEVRKKKLATPLETDDGPVTEAVSEVVWTATGGGTGPGQFQSFPLTLKVPGKAGDALTFKALQTYSDGKVVRWIGMPDSGYPAPVVKVSAAVDAHSMGNSNVPAASTSHSNGHSDTLAIIGIVLGGVALMLAGLALAGTRRGRS